jgi:hypothetical protein
MKCCLTRNAKEASTADESHIIIFAMNQAEITARKPKARLRAKGTIDRPRLRQADRGATDRLRRPRQAMGVRVTVRIRASSCLKARAWAQEVTSLARRRAIRRS